MAAPNEYTRAGNRGATFTGEHRLFIGGDHLLLVVTSGYVELSKRFNFRDIQAIIIQESPARLIWNWFLGFGFAASALVLVLAWSDFPFRMLALGFAALFCIPLVINNARGPTCACHVQSAVQRERLYSLSRTRKARRFLEKVSARLMEAQAGSGQALPGASVQTESPTVESPPQS
jgi:hypothetical protein